SASTFTSTSGSRWAGATAAQGTIRRMSATFWGRVSAPKGDDGAKATPGPRHVSNTFAWGEVRGACVAGAGPDGRLAGGVGPPSTRCDIDSGSRCHTVSRPHCRHAGRRGRHTESVGRLRRPSERPESRGNEMSTQSSRSRLSVPLFLALATLIVSRPAHPQRPAEQGSEEARAAEQGAAGSWEGALTIDDHLYPVMVTLVNLEGGWSGRFSYPVGGITDMPLHSARVAGDTVEVAFRPGYAFRGVLTSSGAVGYRGCGRGTDRSGVGRDRASHNGTHGGATSDAGTSRTGTSRDGTSRDEASRDEASRD